MITGTYENEFCDFAIRKFEGEVRVYFSPLDYYVDEESIKRAIDVLVDNGFCSGIDTARIRFGEIRGYFNPIYHTMADQDRLIRVLCDEIFKSRDDT